MHSDSTDVLVIGAGPAGAVAASILHQAGLRVRIVEKTKFPRFVIGESLLPRCMEALEEAGFLEAIKEKKFQEKDGAKLVKNGKVCDFNFADQFTKGWSWTWQVPRADFDWTLARAVQKKGVPIAFETAVTAVTFEGADSVTTVQDKDGNESRLRARFIVDGSGYGRVLPKLLNLDRPSEQPPRYAIFAHSSDSRRGEYDEPNRIIIIVHKPGVWIWVIPFSTGNSSIGYVGYPEYFKQFPENPEARMRALIAAEPYLAERFKDEKFLFEPRMLEAWSRTTDRFYGDGFVLTGNVTEFLDPVFSSGVTLATVSSQLAGKLVAEKLKGRAVDWEKEYTRPMMQGIDTFRAYVSAWYEGTLDTIFFADEKDDLIKSQICSVLAGYVWDSKNPYVKNHKTALRRLAAMIQQRENNPSPLAGEGKPNA